MYQSWPAEYKIAGQAELRNPTCIFIKAKNYPTCIFIKSKNYVGLSTLHETREGCSKTPIGTVISQLNFFDLFIFTFCTKQCVWIYS